MFQTQDKNPMGVTEGMHIIAEAGTNHNGELGKAKKLVEIAKAAGADSVKFQIISPDGLYLQAPMNTVITI